MSRKIDLAKGTFANQGSETVIANIAQIFIGKLPVVNQKGGQVVSV